MNLSDMNLNEVVERLSQLEVEVRESTDIQFVESATEEKKALLERKAELENLEQRKADAEALERGAKAENIIELPKEGNTKMTIMELRNSQEYINAFENYVRTGDASECRALITDNITGTATDGKLATPVVVEDAIRTAWDNEPIMGLVRKTYLKGNVKIGFEISSTGAVEHTEKGAAVDEEQLVLGIASLVPVSIKKWISITDEALDMHGEEFLQYVYSELGYRIAKKVADEIIADITATTASGSSTVPAQAVVKEAIGLATIAKAVSQLSDEATNPVIVMNKQTYAAFKGVQAAANYGQDIFDGLNVYFNNSLAAYTSADEDDVYAIVGDFGRGAQANFPAGQDIEFKFDDTTLMTQDLVRVMGRMYCGHAVVAPKCFTKITAPAAG